MFAFIENAETSKCDSVVQTLSWMGKTPDNPPEGGSWRLNEASYYHHGWLASGNARGIVGVTFTSCQPLVADHPARTNFYLRGHRSEVVLVKWNEPYQKLATCDVTGIIFVWIKHDGRWSIELINDRSSQVTDFSWSHDGQMALICYKDSFVLVGSVAGQRYWSSMLNLEGCTVTCGIWTPDDQKVMFGTTAGKVIVMSSSGTMIAQVVIHADLEITHLGWSAERFRLTEQTNNNKSTQTDNNRPSTATTNNNNNSLESEEQTSSVKPHILSVVLSVGDILLMTGYDDLCPRVIHTGLRGVKVEWSNDGNFLAVVGHKSAPQFPDVLINELRFYNKLFKLQLSLKIPANQTRQPVTAMTWGHKDQRLFVAVGCELFTVWVFKSVASLQLLCKTSIHRHLTDDIHLHKLPLPAKLLNTVAEVFSPTIKGYIPHPKRLREYVCTSPPWKDRLHCTIMRHGDESSGGCYVLYLEHLGGLIPLLKGKRASKLHPDFVIYDPQVDLSNKREDEMSSSLQSNNLPIDSAVEDSDSDVNAREGSPGIRKKRKFLKLRESLKCRESVGSPNTNEASCEPIFEDSLPETRHLVSITSNIWGTKFRFLGVPPHLPEELGSVTYKTSLLHLQPRQMTVGIVELPRDDGFYGNLAESDCLDNECNSNSYLDADDELYANYFYDIENLDRNSNCMVAISTDNCSENLAATVASNFVEASSSSSFSPNSSLEESSNPKDSNSSKSNLSPSPLLDLSLALQKSTSPTQLGINFPQNVHLANLQSQLNEKIARVSPTEVDPFLEFFMKDRSCHGLGAQLEPSGFVFINNVRDVMNSVGLRQELEEVKQIMLESVQQGCYIKDEMTTTSRKIISSISDVTLVSSETITPEVNVAMQDHVEDSADIRSQRSEVKQAPVPGVSLQFIDDDNDPLVDLYEQCQMKKDVSSEFDNLSARDVMIQSSVEVLGSPVKMVAGQSRDAKERHPVDSMTYSPSKNIIMKPLMCGKAAVSSSECSDFDSIQSMCSFEPCKTRLLITAGGGINSLTPEQTPSKLGRLSIGSVSKSRLREIARNALCRGNSSTGASCVGSGNAGGTGNAFCGHHNGRPKRRFFNGLCGISDPRGSSGNRHSVEDVPRSSDSSSPGSPVRIQQKAHRHRHGSLDVRACEALAGVASLSSSFHSTNLTAMPCSSRASDVHHLSASLPSSPIHKQLTSRQSSLANRPKHGHFLAAPSSTSHGNRLAGRSQLQSPLLLSRRRVNKCNQAAESSDEEHLQSSEDVTTSENYQNLETFQKARLHKKLKKVRSRNGENENLENASRAGSPSVSPQHQQTCSPRKFSPKSGSAPPSTSKNTQAKQKPLRHFVMHNKAPMWNDSSQVYQLDFGGRVTQESAKNFQIEFGGKQVMQFGRIDNNAYTLDFQYPYSATQAFAVALANVTQRLK